MKKKKNRQMSLWSFPRALNPKFFTAGDGKNLRLYTLPALVLMTGKSAVRLREYEECGIMPVTPYRIPHAKKSTRYYTFDQMRVVRETLHDMDVHGNHEEIKRRIILGWAISGVPIEPGLNFDSALRLSVGSTDCEPVEKEFLLRALETEKGKNNGQTESGPVDGTWYYLTDDAGETSHKKKSKGRLARDFNQLCSGGKTFSDGLVRFPGRGDGDDEEPLYTPSGSRLWRRPRSG